MAFCKFAYLASATIIAITNEKKNVMRGSQVVVEVEKTNIFILIFCTPFNERTKN